MQRIVTIILLLVPVMIYGQNERKMIRQGYKAYMDGEYNQAEVEFRKAEDVDKESFTAKYNTSAAMYQQEKIDESAKRFEELLAETTDDKDEAKLYHNLGNSFLETNKLQESIEAYKRSLRLNPEDEDTRYNLAYALEKLQEQEQQQQQQDQDQDNKDDQNQDQNEDQKSDQNKDQEEQDKKEDQQEQQDQQEQEDEKQQESQPQQQQLSKEEAERLLDAILQKEKDVKEKVDQKKAAAAKVKSDKDW